MPRPKLDNLINPSLVQSARSVTVTDHSCVVVLDDGAQITYQVALNSRFERHLTIVAQADGHRAQLYNAKIDNRGAEALAEFFASCRRSEHHLISDPRMRQAIWAEIRKRC